MSRLDSGDEGCHAWIQERRAPFTVLRAPWVTLALGALRRTATIGSGQEGCPGCSAGPRFIPTVGAARHRLSAGANRPSVLTGGSLNRQSVRPGLAFALAKTASRVLSRHYTLNKDILARVPREAGCKSRPLRRLK